MPLTQEEKENLANEGWVLVVSFSVLGNVFIEDSQGLVEFEVFIDRIHNLKDLVGKLEVACGLRSNDEG